MGFLKFCFQVSFLPSLHLLRASDLGPLFTFSQDHIDDTTEESQWEGHPGQDVGESIGVIRVKVPF